MGLVSEFFTSDWRVTAAARVAAPMEWLLLKGAY